MLILQPLLPILLPEHCCRPRLVVLPQLPFAVGLLRVLLPLMVISPVIVLQMLLASSLAASPTLCWTILLQQEQKQEKEPKQQPARYHAACPALWHAGSCHQSLA